MRLKLRSHYVKYVRYGNLKNSTTYTVTVTYGTVSSKKNTEEDISSNVRRIHSKCHQFIDITCNKCSVQYPKYRNEQSQNPKETRPTVTFQALRQKQGQYAGQIRYEQTGICALIKRQNESRRLGNEIKSDKSKIQVSYDVLRICNIFFSLQIQFQLSKCSFPRMSASSAFS